nr:hypothetical protein 15 [bacterium]
MVMGDTPHILRGGQTDYKRLFFSDQNIAMIKPITIPAGFGTIPAGAVMAKISESTNRAGRYVPYTPEAPSLALNTARGAAYLTTDGAASTSVYVTMADSYKFAVGDHLAVADANSYNASAVDLGAITAIDRTTYEHIALITVTNQVTTAFTVAQGAWVWIQSKTTAPYVQAVGILAGAVETGTGENAQGGHGALILGNAMLYKDLLENYDSEALTDLGGTEDGEFLILT